MTVNFYRIKPCAAFSLIEILGVIAIVSLMSILTLPAILSTVQRSQLPQGGQLLSDSMRIARSEAITRNSEVEIRFFNIKGAYRAFQIFDFYKDKEEGLPITPLKWLPTGIVIADAKISPLLDETYGTSGTTDLAGFLEVAYCSIRFRSNGSLKKTPGNFPYLTVLSESDLSHPSKANLFILQLDPVTGRQTIYRP